MTSLFPRDVKYFDERNIFRDSTVKTFEKKAFIFKRADLLTMKFDFKTTVERPMIHGWAMATIVVILCTVCSFGVLGFGSNGAANHSVAKIGLTPVGILLIEHSSSGQSVGVIAQPAVIVGHFSFTLNEIDTGSSGQWHGVASSASGQYLVAVSSTGSGIWTSSNYGASWVNEGNSAPTWYAVTSSSSGQYMVAVTNAGGSGTSPGIWNSSNYGVNWAQQTSAPTGVYWTSVASNSSGQDLVAVQFSGDIWTSTNYGKTWNDQGNSGLWRSVASSSSGQYLVAVQQNGDIWASNNYGISTSWVDEGN